MFENVIYDQGNEYVDKFLNKSHFVAFVKLTQRSMHFSDFLRKCQKELKSSGIVGAILMDLSKAYDCLPHDLIIAKLEAYDLDTNSLRFLFDYLSSRKQRTKMESTYWSEVFHGIPQDHYC